MDLLYKRLSNLLSEKSIITNVILALLVYSVVQGTVTGDQLLGMANTIVGFFFGVQIEKHFRENNP